MHLRTYGWIIALAILFTGSLLPRQASGATNIYFEPTAIPLSDPEIANPGRGLYRWSDQTFIAPAELISNRDSYRRFRWQDLEAEQGQYDFAVLDEFIESAAKRGQRAILGLPQPMGSKSNSGSRMPGYLTSESYGIWWNGTFWPDFNNPFVLERLEALVRALGERYDGDPRVSMIQMVHYGTYGEYHIPYDAPESISRITRENARRTIAAFQSAFPRTRLSAMVGNSGGGYMTRAALLASEEIGLSRMALGCDQQMEKFDELWNDPEIGETLRNRWKRAPLWTEMYGLFGGNCADQFAQALKQVPYYHVSYVSNGNFAEPYDAAPYTKDGKPNASTNWTQQNIDDLVMAGKLAGYRYVVKQVAADDPRAGQDWKVVTTWANDGSAPVYEPWEVRFKLQAADGTIVWEEASRVDLQTVLPPEGNTSVYTVEDSFTLPNTLRNGAYRLLLSVPALNDYVAPLQLAIHGQQQDGSYLLGELQVVYGSEGPAPALEVIEPTPGVPESTAQSARSVVYLPIVGVSALSSQSAGDPPPSDPPPARSDVVYYVAPNGANGDARSWEAAWPDFDRIAWAKIKPGDTIKIAAGTYNKPLVVGASGTDKLPIFIEADGEVRMFGGRETPLPYCGQPDYQGDSGQSFGVDLSGRAHIVIDGGAWSGIKIYGWRHGIQMDAGTDNIRLRYIEVFDNGVAQRAAGGWQPNEEGIYMDSSTNITVERAIIHDNGHDSFQVSEGLTNFTLRESWMYNKRTDPQGNVFNACRHPDGMQILGAAGRSSNIRFEESVLGPGLYHTFLANDGTQEGLVFRDILIYDALTSTIAVRSSKARGWVIDHVTSVRPKDGRMNLEISGSDHSITNSIIVGGSSNKLPGDTGLENNYQYQVGGARVGPDLEPRFRNPKSGDFAPQAAVNGAGSRLTSVESLMARQ